MVVRKPAAVDHCHSYVVVLTGSLSALALARIDSLAPELTRALTSRVLYCLSYLSAGMTSFTNIIGVKWICFSFLEYLDCLSFFIGWILRGV